MSMTVKYGSYAIRSLPLRRRDNSQWKIEITIFWEHDGIITMRPFTSESNCQTEERADISGIRYGRQIIDGHVPGVSLQKSTNTIRDTGTTA